MEEKLEFLPDINQFIEDDKTISIEGLEELIYKVRANTGLELEQAKILVRLYFQEIRNCLLKRDSVYLFGLGTFSRDKVHDRIRFKVDKKIKKIING